MFPFFFIALNALACMPVQTEGKIESLIDALESKSASVRRESAKKLAMLEKIPRLSLGRILDLYLHEPEFSVRVEMWHVLMKHEKDTFALLVEYSTNKKNARNRRISALLLIRRDHPDYSLKEVQSIIPLLNEEGDLAFDAACVIVYVDPDNEQAARIILARIAQSLLIEDIQERISELSVTASLLLGSKNHKEFAAQILHHSTVVRVGQLKIGKMKAMTRELKVYAIAAALAGITRAGVIDQAHVKFYSKLFDDLDPKDEDYARLRLYAAIYLGQPRINNKRATRHLEDNLKVLSAELEPIQDIELQLYIIRAIEELGPRAREAIPVLEAKVLSDNRLVREAAATAIKAIKKQ